MSPHREDRYGISPAPTAPLKRKRPPRRQGGRALRWGAANNPRLLADDVCSTPEREIATRSAAMSTSNPKTKKKTKGRKSNATKLAHKKFRFIEQVIADSRLSPLATRVTIYVGSRCSLDHGGQAIIGQDKIGEKLGAWSQNVNEALKQAVALGHLEIIRRGRD